MRIIRKLRHIILLAVLVGSDILIGFFGHYQGSGGGDFIEYITTLSLGEIAPTIGVAIVVVLIVEYLFRH